MSIKAIDRDLAQGSTVKTASARSRLPVLGYHSVCDTMQDTITVSLATFREQMHWLSEAGIEVISLEEAGRRLDARGPLGGSVVLTFDDGYKDFIEAAVPVMDDLGFTATVFVISDGFVWPDDPHGRGRLSPEDLRDLRRRRYSIGSHSVSHARLISLSRSDLDRELIESKARLEDVLGAAVTTFAYPYGHFGKRERDAVEHAGYTLACGIGGIWGNGYGTDRLALSRFIISSGQSARDFRSLVLARLKTPAIRGVLVSEAKRLLRPGIDFARRRFQT